MFELLVKTLHTGLSLWDSKEKNKYRDKLIELERAYREEKNKDPAHRSDAILDNLEFELRLISIGFNSSVGEQNLTNK